MTLSTIGQIAMNARDIDRATTFYRDVLGLPFLFSAGSMSFFACQGTRLMLGVASGPEYDHPGSILYFSVDDIGATHQLLASRGVVFRTAPHLVARMPDHELWMAFFDDTEGNTLALMAEVREQAPGAGLKPQAPSPQASRPTRYNRSVADAKFREDLLSDARADERVDTPRLWRVLLHNDDFTTQDFVVWVLESVFQRSAADARAIMLHVHNAGVGVAGLYTRDVAETKQKATERLAEQEEFPLLVTLEPEPEGSTP